MRFFLAMLVLGLLTLGVVGPTRVVEAARNWRAGPPGVWHNEADCPDGQVWDGAIGACHAPCDAGQRFDVLTWSCQPIDGCGEGKHLENGHCVTDGNCGEGKHLESGHCVADEPGDNCPQGQHKKNGTCVADEDCPQGKHLEGEDCVDDQGCPDGQVVKGEECVPREQCDAGLAWDPITQSCQPAVDCGEGKHLESGHCVNDEPGDDCGEGQHKKNGSCVPDESCPQGTHLKDGTCVSDDPTKCPQGQHLKDGACVPDEQCPQGRHLKDGLCVADEPGDNCGPGRHKENNDCVPDGQCDAGTHLENGACVTDEDCPEGTHLEGTTCVPTQCDEGQHLEGGACVPNKQCPQGTHLSGSHCVADEPGDDCGQGQHKQNGTCVPDEECPEGTHLNNGHCVTDQECPEGTHLENGNCEENHADWDPGTGITGGEASPLLDDISIKAGDGLTLHVSQATDLDTRTLNGVSEQVRDGIRYRWKIVQGPGSLSGGNSNSATYTAPSLANFPINATVVPVRITCVVDDAWDPGQKGVTAPETGSRGDGATGEQSFSFTLRKTLDGHWEHKSWQESTLSWQTNADGDPEPIQPDPAVETLQWVDTEVHPDQTTDVTVPYTRLKDDPEATETGGYVRVAKYQAYSTVQNGPATAELTGQRDLPKHWSSKTSLEGGTLTVNVDGRALADNPSSSEAGETTSISVPAGTGISLNVSGMEDNDTSWYWHVASTVVNDPVTVKWTSQQGTNPAEEISGANPTWSATVPGEYELVGTVDDAWTEANPGVTAPDLGDRNDGVKSHRVVVTVVPRHWEANPEIGEKPLFNSDGSPVLVNGVQQYQQNGRMLAPQDQRAASAAGYQPQTVQARPGDKIDLQVEAATDYDSWTTSSSGGYEPDGIKYQWSVVPPDGVTVGTLTNATSPHAQWTVPSGTTAGTYTLKCTIDDTWDTDAASIKPPGETGNRNDASLVRSVQVVVSSQASWAEFKVLTKEDGLESRDGVENDEKYDPIGGTVWPMLYLHIGPGEHVDPSIQSVTLRIEDIEPEVAGQTDPLPYWEHDISFLDDANMATWEMYKENDNEGNPLPEEQRWVKVASLTEGDAATVRLFRAKFAWDTTTKPLGLNGSHNIRVSKVTDTNPATVDENLTQVRFVASGIPYESGPAVRVVNVQNVQDVKDLYYSLDSRPLPTNGKQWTKVPMPGDADHPNADYPLVVGQAETVFFKVGKKLDAYDWPDGKPVWAGDADGIMQAEPGKDVMGVAFLRASTPDNDLQTISATCTNTVTASVRVKKSYVLTVAPEDGQPTQLLAGGADNRSKTAMVVHLTDAENQPVSNTAVNLSSMYVDEDGNPTTVAAGNIGGTGVQTNPDGSKYITLDQQGTGHFLLTTYTVPTPLGGAMVEGSLQDAAMPVKKEGSSLEFLSPNVNAESKDWEQVSSSEVGYLQSEHIFVLDFAGSPVGNRKVSIRVTGISEVNSDGSETPLTFDNVNKIENWATFESGPDNQNPDIFFTGDGTNNSVGAIVVNLVWLMPGINPRDYKIYYEVLDMHTP